MKQLNLSLRTKSMLAMVVACLIALGPTIFIGWQMLEHGRAQLGQAYAQNFTLLSAQRIEAPISKELAIAQLFADSVLLRQWLQDPDSEQKKSHFFRQADVYQKSFQGHNYFFINRKTLAYYLNNQEKPYSREPRYFLDPENPDDAWFFKTMQEFDAFNINVNPDVHLGETRVWINIPVWVEGEKLGLAGTGLELGAFLEKFIAAEEPGVTPMILNSRGLIQAHPDKSLIAYGSGTKTSSNESYLKDLLATPAQGRELEEAMERARSWPGTVETLWAGLDGKKQLLALTWIPELSWHVVSSVDLKSAQVLGGTWIAAAVAILIIMLIILLLVFGYAVEKLVLRPLGALHRSATALAHGDYDVSLPSARGDEIGDLNQAFSSMVEEIKSHTRELEEKVRARTSELESQSILLQEAKENAEMAHAAKAEILNKVMESIHYAQTIQQAILTTEIHLESLVSDCFSIWKPKDVISGDMIWSKEHEDGFALAVLDCTGHGVPGGVMTMAAVSSLNRVVSEIGLKDPQAVLKQLSRVIQKMFTNQEGSRFSEDGLDMGLCVYFASSRTLVYAGSRLNLFYSQDKELVLLKGDKQSLGYQSSDPDFPFQNHVIELKEKMEFYLATDGLFDQIGQQTGLPLGKRRVRAFLSSIKGKSMQEQKQALLEFYENYQGHEEQRDDLSVLGFCLYP